MLDLDKLAESADTTARVVKGGREWKFAKLNSLMVEQANRVKSVIGKGDSGSACELLALLAQFAGCDATPSDVADTFADWEMGLIAEEVAKPVTMGE